MKNGKLLGELVKNFEKNNLLKKNTYKYSYVVSDTDKRVYYKDLNEEDRDKVEHLLKSSGYVYKPLLDCYCMKPESSCMNMGESADYDSNSVVFLQDVYRVGNRYFHGDQLEIGGHKRNSNELVRGYVSGYLGSVGVRMGSRPVEMSVCSSSDWMSSSPLTWLWSESVINEPERVIYSVRERYGFRYADLFSRVRGFTPVHPTGGYDYLVSELREELSSCCDTGRVRSLMLQVVSLSALYFLVSMRFMIHEFTEESCVASLDLRGGCVCYYGSGAERRLLINWDQFGCYADWLQDYLCFSQYERCISSVYVAVPSECCGVADVRLCECSDGSYSIVIEGASV